MVCASDAAAGDWVGGLGAWPCRQYGDEACAILDLDVVLFRCVACEAVQPVSLPRRSCRTACGCGVLWPALARLVVVHCMQRLLAWRHSASGERLRNKACELGNICRTPFGPSLGFMSSCASCAIIATPARRQHISWTILYWGSKQRGRCPTLKLQYNGRTWTHTSTCDMYVHACKHVTSEDDPGMRRRRSGQSNAAAPVLQLHAHRTRGHGVFRTNLIKSQPYFNPISPAML